jgi:hypothetical protein
MDAYYIMMQRKRGSSTGTEQTLHGIAAVDSSDDSSAAPALEPSTAQSAVGQVVYTA